MEEDDLSQLNKMLERFFSNQKFNNAEQLFRECVEILAECTKFHANIEIFNSQRGSDDVNDDKGAIWLEMIRFYSLSSVLQYLPNTSTVI